MPVAVDPLHRLLHPRIQWRHQPLPQTLVERWRCLRCRQQAALLRAICPVVHRVVLRRWPEGRVKPRLVRSPPVVLSRDKCKASTLASLRFNHRPPPVRPPPVRPRPVRPRPVRPRLVRSPPVRPRLVRSPPVRPRLVHSPPVRPRLVHSPPVRPRLVRSPPVPVLRRARVLQQVRVLQQARVLQRAQVPSILMARRAVLAFPAAREARARRVAVNSPSALLKPLY